MASPYCSAINRHVWIAYSQSALPAYDVTVVLMAVIFQLCLHIIPLAKSAPNVSLKLNLTLTLIVTMTVTLTSNPTKPYKP